jgi:peptidoglycan hydrolase-like protein with peptidoglycan-binding domain
MSLELLELYYSYELNPVNEAEKLEDVKLNCNLELGLVRWSLCSLVVIGIPTANLPASALSLNEPLPENLELRDLLRPAEPNSLGGPKEKESSSLFAKPYYQAEPKIEKKAKTLSLGAQGPKIASLQKRLQSKGFDPGPIDSIFGEQTKIAVQKFQEAKSLNADGVVDEATWIALNTAQEPTVKTNKFLEPGDKGKKVKILQVILQDLGYDPGPIDGSFGGRTAKAVQKFQESMSLKPDGIVDQKTWEVLNRN